MNNEEFFYIAVQKTLKGRKEEREKGCFFALCYIIKGKPAIRIGDFPTTTQINEMEKALFQLT